MPDVSPEAPHYNCPACGAVIAAATGQRLLVCPECGEQSFIPDEPPTGTSPDEHLKPAESSTSPEAELNGLRIRQVANLRRGAYRSRSWSVIAAVCCLVGAAQLVQMAVHVARHGRVMLPIGFCLAAAAALLGSGYFIRSAVLLTREIRSSSLSEPSTPPDFSSLSDGSQHWRNLDEISGGKQ